MKDYGLTEKGIRIKRLSDIMDEIHDDLTEKWGVNTRQNPQSYLNVLITDFSDRIAELWEVGQEIYYSAFPMTAEGVYLDNAAQYAGLYRGQGRQSQYYLKCTGRDGNVIPSGLVVSTNLTMSPVTYLTIMKSYPMSLDRTNYAEVRFPTDEYFTDDSVDDELYITINGREDPESGELKDGERFHVNGKKQYTVTEYIWEWDYESESASDKLPDDFDDVQDAENHRRKDLEKPPVVTKNDDGTTTTTTTEIYEKDGIQYRKVITESSRIPDAKYVFEEFEKQINASGVGSDYFTAKYESRVNGSETIHYLLLTAKTATGNHKVALSKELTTERMSTICTFLTEDYGDIYLPNGSVTAIHGNESGLESVVNVGNYIPGSIAETDTEFRKSYIDRIFSHSNRMCDSIRSAILNNVPNVISCRVFENITDFYDSYGRPPHSVEAVVQGGNEDEIAVQIFNTKAAGINTYGDVELFVTDGGQEVPIRFNRPKKIIVNFDVEVSPLDDGSQAIDANTAEYDTSLNGWQGVVKQIIIKKVNSLASGESVIPQDLFMTDIYKNVSGIDYIKVRMWTDRDVIEFYDTDEDGNLTSEVTSREYTTHKNLYFDYNEIAVTSDDNIKITVEGEEPEEDGESDDY